MPTPFSSTDSRSQKPNSATTRNINGTLTADVQTPSNPSEPPIDSRTQGAPTPSATYPQNSRTPGVNGPNN